MAQRTAVVTGASRGLGRAIAQRLASDGLHVVLVARGAHDLSEVLGGIAAVGGTGEARAGDVRDAAFMQRTVEDVVAQRGTIDVLVNNAGSNVRKPAESLDAGSWNDVLDLCLSAPFRWAQAVLPAMRSKGFGRIVNVGSVAGLVALPTGAAYAAAKAGLHHLTRVLAREWGPHGVTVNCVAPWYVRTPLTTRPLDDPAYREAVLRCTPAGRLGTPEDVAAAVSFLVGDEAGWINGAVLPLDGGASGASFFP